MPTRGEFVNDNSAKVGEISETMEDLVKHQIVKRPYWVERLEKCVFADQLPYISIGSITCSVILE